MDWLEDALLKNRKLPETEYLLTTFLKEEQGKLLEAKKKARADFLEARFVNTSKVPSPVFLPILTYI